MTARQIIYSSTIIVLGFIQSVPALLCLASTNIIVIVLGIFYSILLGIFWSSTIIGKWFFRELWRSTLRLENVVYEFLAGSYIFDARNLWNIIIPCVQGSQCPDGTVDSLPYHAVKIGKLFHHVIACNVRRVKTQSGD